jgi:hypothetical protein
LEWDKSKRTPTSKSGVLVSFLRTHTTPRPCFVRFYTPNARLLSSLITQNLFPMSVPPRLSSLSTLPNGNGYRPQQQQQSQPRNGCSTKVWIERLLFVAIGVLASLGVVYHNRVTVSLGHIDHSEDYAVLPSSVEREKVRELINTKNSGMMDDQQRKRGERKNRLRALFASGKQQFFRVKYKDATIATEGTKEEVTATATATALEEEEEKQRQKEIVVQQQEKELLEVQEVQRREREEEEEKQRQKEIVVQQQEKELLEVQEVQRREREKEEKLENVAAEKNSNKNADEEARTADSDETTSTTNTANTKDRLNIVLFYADDWTMKVLGKLNADVHTPNIDEMANNGMLFTNNCVTTSVCWMSRATLMTGVYSSRHRQSEPSAMGIYTTNPWSETLFPLLKKAGYYTGLVGKWHAPQPEEAMREAFDVQNFYYGEHVFDHFGTMRHVTDLNREHGMEFLQNRPRDKNFALKVSFFATHAWDGHYPSYVPMNGTREKYYPDNISIDQPKTATNEHWEDLPPFFTESNEGRNRWRRRFEPDYFQDNIKDLYSLATEVDSAIGEIIKVLKEQGVYDNTYLLFTTDNGNLHG